MAISTPRIFPTAMGVLPVVAEMQRNGLPVSRSRLLSLYDDLTDRMCVTQARISNLYYDGRPFNPGSSDQTAILMRRRGLEGTQRTSTGKTSTAKTSIEHLRYEDPAMAEVFDWRELEHHRDGFVAPLLAQIPESAPDIWPVRCEILTTRTPTRRFAAKNPNLLAMPKHSALGKAVRNCFVAPPGMAFLECDLSQVEARALAHESADPELVRLFCAGRDIHAETAHRLFGVPPDAQDKSKHRLPAKTTNFSVIYGISGPGLRRRLWMEGLTSWTDASCTKMLADWFRIYRGVRRYIDQETAAVRRIGEVRDHWGMLRYLPGAWSDDPKIAAEAGRMAVSHKVQGLAQGMIQNAMAWLAKPIRQLQDAGVRVDWRLQVHDSLLLTVEEEEVDLVESVVLEGLTNHAGVEMRVPVKADASRAESWGGLS